VTASSITAHDPAAGARRLYAAVSDPKPTAIVIHCSDPRFQGAFEQFTEHELGLKTGEFIPIIVGGGAGVLGHPEQLPKEFKFIKERLEHYYRIFPTAKRIVLINHEGCRYYQSIKAKTLGLVGSRFADAAGTSRDDLSLVAQTFRHFLSHLGYRVELYYAKFANLEHTKIEIEKVF
jgi:hypothetical protein